MKYETLKVEHVSQITFFNYPVCAYHLIFYSIEPMYVHAHTQSTKQQEWVRVKYGVDKEV